MEIEILQASLPDKPVLENLMQLYVYDFTEYTGDDADEQGRFTAEHLELYWVEPGRYPFRVAVDGKHAGFVLVRAVTGPQDGQVIHHIAEFFIMKKYRRQHIGQQVAWRIFDRFPGAWHVAEMEENHPAQKFWRCIINQYTGGAYQEVLDPEWKGPIQRFCSPQDAKITE